MTSNWPSQYPSSVRPRLHATAPMTLKRVNTAVAHPGRARGDRRQRAHDRHEPGEHDGERAALLEEPVSLVEILLLEEARVRLEHRRADVATDPIPDLPTEHGGDRDEDEQLPELKINLWSAVPGSRGGPRGEHAGDKEQRVARKDGKEHTGLDEHDDQQPQQRPGAEVADELDRIQEIRHQRETGRSLGEGSRGHGSTKIPASTLGAAVPGCAGLPPGDKVSYAHPQSRSGRVAGSAADPRRRRDNTACPGAGPHRRRRLRGVRDRPRASSAAAFPT